MVVTKMCQLFTQRAEALTKMKVDHNEFVNVVSRLFDAVIIFNNLGDDAQFMWSRPLSEVRVIEEITDFIYPATIRFNSSDRAYSNLLDKTSISIVDDETLNRIKTLSYSEFQECQIKFRSYYRLGIDTKVKPVSECRKNLSLSEAIDFSSINGKVCYTNKAFIPYPLISEVHCLDNRNVKFCINEDLVIEDYFADLTF